MTHVSLLIYTFLLVSLFQPTLTYSWGLFSPMSNWFSSTNGKELAIIEDATRKLKLVSPNSCWHTAYANLFACCSEIIADKEKQSRLAWHLSDCFQKDSGRPPFPSCDETSPMEKCLKNLDDNTRTTVYLAFFGAANSICHQLQANAFKFETERLVKDLKQSAKFAEDKLENIEERSEQLLDNSNQIQNKLNSFDLQMEQVAQAAKDIEEQNDVVLNYSKVVFEQSKEIEASQSVLQGEQSHMREKLEEGFTMIDESYKNLGQDMEKLRSEAIKIETQITEVSNSMSLKLLDLQNKADDIGNNAGISLDNQNQLLDGQSTALEGLQVLTTFQSQALEESRVSLQKLAKFAQEQQEELLVRQEELKRAHDLLVESSKSILAAQKAFEAKQENMSAVMHNLFTLYNNTLSESRLIKLFIYYPVFTYILYMVTSAKQTYNVRARLILGLGVTFLIEFRFGDDIDQHEFLASKTKLARLCFAVLAFIQIVISMYTYKDCEVLNYKMLQNLMEKFNTMETHKYLADVEESDDNLSWWINTEASDDEDVSSGLHEEVAENSVATTSLMTRKYDLRSRLRR